ncbi:hypothetical protein U9M48_010163, partial [Paspalum notatum var. saurae]
KGGVHHHHGLAPRAPARPRRWPRSECPRQTVSSRVSAFPDDPITCSPISARFPSPAVIPEADPARHPRPAFRPATQPDRKLTQIALFNADRLPPPPPSSTRITSLCRIAFTRRPASSTANIDIEKAAAYKHWLMRATRIRIGGSANSVHNDDNVLLQCASCVRCGRHLCWRQTRVDGMTEQMSRVVNELDSIHFSIKKASQLVKEIGTQVATDRCIMAMPFLIVSGVIAIIIVKIYSL